MSKLEMVKQEIVALSESERAELYDWMHGFAAEEDEVDADWDERCAVIIDERLARLESGQDARVSSEEVKRRMQEKYGVDF